MAHMETDRSTARPSASDAAFKALDKAMGDVHEGSMRFQQVSYADKASLLRNLIPRAVAAAEEWVQASCIAKGIRIDSHTAGEEWIAGPAVTVRNMRLLAESMDVLAQGRQPFDALKFRTRTDGKCEVNVFPASRFDAVLFGGFTAKVTLRTPEPTLGCFNPAPERTRIGSPICVVLGAGNVSSIPAMDVLYKVFCEGKPCVLKMNPVNGYLAPIFEKVFEPLIALGILRIVQGGAAEGSYLCNHRLAGEVHITGSDATHDAIVWGPPGPEHDARKANDLPVLKVPITSELGNISPVIVVPGSYTIMELATMARNVVTQVVNNGSFNCNAAKMLVTSKHWEQREEFLRLVRGLLKHAPTRKAYYPGAKQRYLTLLKAKARSGNVVITTDAKVTDDALPWMFVTGLDPNDRSEPLFRTEPFCGILSETALDATDEFDFMYKAGAFCNERLWGTLNACVMVSPASEKDDMFAMSLEHLVDELRYGTVGINHWPAVGYALVTTPWGGYPGATIKDPQSGIGWVHNTFMLGAVEKVVIRGPLVARPKPAWFYDNAAARTIGRKLVAFEAEPSWLKIPSIALTALFG